jgi:hypothetical protein
MITGDTVGFANVHIQVNHDLLINCEETYQIFNQAFHTFLL